MIVLAIDTCFNRCAACLYNAATGRVMADIYELMEKGHAEALAPMVQDLLTSAQKKPEDIARVAVTTGPGTFTGVRIGLSFARAFGLARNIPVLGLDTLRALRLKQPQAVIAHKAGQSGFAYLLRGEDLALVDAAVVPPLAIGTLRQATDLPDLIDLAIWAASQPVPSQMPEPVYLREADAKPQVPVPITIRDATPADLAMLAQIHSASFSQGWSGKDITEMMQISGTLALVAVKQDQVQAFLLSRAIAGEAEILTLAVSPTARKQGLGRKLLNELCARKELNVIHLEVADANIAAKALYVSAGFKETGRRKAYYADGDDAVMMARTLKWSLH